MIIGNFTYDKSNDTYQGSISTLLIDRLGIHLRPTRRGSEREPAYRIVRDGEAGTIELGAAWSRKSDKGQAYLSVVLDDPSLGQSVHAAMFPDAEGKATLVWNRPRSDSPKAEPDRPSAKGRRPHSGRALRPGQSA